MFPYLNRLLSGPLNRVIGWYARSIRAGNIMKYLLLSLFLLTGCKPNYPFETLCLNKTLQNAIPLIEKDVKTRFPHALLIICHGENFEGRWYLDRDNGPILVEEFLLDMRTVAPYRTIILHSCNKLGYTIKGFKNVYYYKNNVWSIPDQFAIPISINVPLEDVMKMSPFCHEIIVGEGFAGSIKESVEAK